MISVYSIWSKKNKGVILSEAIPAISTIILWFSNLLGCSGSHGSGERPAADSSDFLEPRILEITRNQLLNFRH